MKIINRDEIITPDSFSSLSLKLQKFIDDGDTGSILCAVYHKDKIVYSNKFGWKDKENQMPIAFGDIFRIYSMTKPIVSLAALILHAEGKYELDDPISNYLPEFKSMKILKSYNPETGEIETTDTNNQITIKHLFTHTSGISYGMYPGMPIDKFYGKELGYSDEYRMKSVAEAFHQKIQLEEFSKQLAELPLTFESGKYWWYGWNHDILGLLIEKLSNTKLDVFLRERIFNKLGMKDTDFYVPKEKWDRLTKVYTKDTEGNLLELRGIIADEFKYKPIFFSGGGGLVSTLDDFMKFCVMMLNGGTYEDQQIVSEKTVELMISDHLPAGRDFIDMQIVKPEDPEIIKQNEGFGVGLGVLVKTGENMWASGIGEYGWDGVLNTTFRVDPANQVIMLLMTQYLPVDDLSVQPILYSDLNPLVYEGIYNPK